VSAPPGDTGSVTEPAAVLDLDDALRLLREGELEVEGRLVDASNATLYCAVTHNGVSAACVYKPIAGERPLWDFPDGTLADRELAAYLVSAATGWDIVPPTVMRDGPYGIGMCQLWIDIEPTVDLGALARSNIEPLRRMAVFDAVINNADRKGGHLLPVPDGHVYGVDHGVCFSAEHKLRTLLWGWQGKKLTEEAVAVLHLLKADMAGSGSTRCLMATGHRCRGRRSEPRRIGSRRALMAFTRRSDHRRS
jgi:hypothetical protein